MFRRGITHAHFLAELQAGNLALLLAEAKRRGFDVQIRENYLNFYKDGCSLLKLSSKERLKAFEAEIATPYLRGTRLCSSDGKVTKFSLDANSIAQYVDTLDAIVDKAARYRHPEATAEEALIWRSLDPDSPLLFIDRQIQVPGIRKRADLMGIKPDGRLVLVELKQGLDNRIQDLVTQISGYLEVLADPVTGKPKNDVLDAYRTVLRQKAELGIVQSMRAVSDEPMEALLLLYDYNPKSKLLPRLNEAARSFKYPLRLVQLQAGQFHLPPAADWELLNPQAV